MVARSTMSRSPENDAREVLVGELGRAYVDALLCGDEAGAEIAIREAMDAGLATAEIDDEIIAPALWLVGELWERGEISVAEEHIATEISIRVLALQREAQRVAAARGDHLVMLAAPSGELHVVALRMVDNLLRNAGYDVVMLGADVPAEALAVSVSRRRPHVVCLTATMAGGADQAMASIRAVQQRWPAVRFVIGGRGLPSRTQSRPGIEVCRRVSDVVEAVDALVRGAGLN
jgi:methanogenic corrinoid protein MtbC1